MTKLDLFKESPDLNDILDPGEWSCLTPSLSLWKNKHSETQMKFLVTTPKSIAKSRQTLRIKVWLSFFIKNSFRILT